MKNLRFTEFVYTQVLYFVPGLVSIVSGVIEEVGGGVAAANLAGETGCHDPPLNNFVIKHHPVVFVFQIMAVGYKNLLSLKIM